MQKTTNRGFGFIKKIDANGQGYSIQESSACSEEAMLWLGIDDARPLLSTRMHLTRSQVIELIGELQEWADNNE